jgi:hypothetical protein
MDTRPRSVVTVARASIVAGMLLTMACTPHLQRPGALPPLGLRAAVAIDAQHNQVVAGTFTGEVQLGGTTLKSAGGTDVFVAKFNPEGKLLWPPLRFGGVGDETTNAVAASSKDGSIAFVGTFTRDLTIETTSFRSTSPVETSAGVFIAVLDAGGKLKWAREVMNVDAATPTSVAIDPENGNIAIGATLLTSVPGQGDRHPEFGMSITLTLLSPNGAPVGAPLTMATTLAFSCVHSPCVTADRAPLFGLCDWCVSTICGWDNTCCTQHWEQKCVDMVWSVCGQRCSCDVCTMGYPFNRYACKQTGQVCGDIPNCCRTSWGRDCLIDANKTCASGCIIPP